MLAIATTAVKQILDRPLPATAVVVTLLDQCLAAYPPGEWERLETQLVGLFVPQETSATRYVFTE